MTVTIIVYVTVLAPLVDLDGAAYWTDIAFHYVAPLMTILGWLMFGPWPRLDRRSVLVMLIWPVSYLVYVLVYGAISGWYPYPFLDVDEHGYGGVLLNSLGVTALLLAIGAAYSWLDPRRAASARMPARRDGRAASTESARMRRPKSRDLGHETVPYIGGA